MKYPQVVSMPSAVSDWLEEQLEARGIDAVVYTRYILSLLHSDAVDVILSEDDQQFSHLKKEVKRSGGGYKCFRRSSDWWKYAQAEAEQLKRSAAVECLLSASEQNCGIESLIDELCDKLNEIKGDVKKQSTPSPTDLSQKKQPSADVSELQRASPQELAKRYYAAFPPLNRNSSNYPTKSLSLIPKWIPSPKKSTTTTTTTTTIIPTTKNNNIKKTKHYNDNMKGVRSNIGRQRCTANNYFNKVINNNNNRKEGYNKYIKNCGKSVVGKTKMDVENFKFGSSIYRNDDDNDGRVIGNDDNIKNWEFDDCDNDSHMYDDLPLDIKELLDDDSPVSHTVEMMNIANMRDTGKRDFIQCGTNIITSIWSTDAMDTTENSLDFKFNTISFDSNTWNLNENNQLNNNNNNNGYWQWSENIYKEEPIINHLTLSFIKLNHSKESSPFSEVKPRSNKTSLNNPFKLKSFPSPTIPLKTVYNSGEKDDLLTSANSHFKPIQQHERPNQHSQYADGATFIISNSLDKVNYKRSESGAMYLESDYGIRKKYCEYKTNIIKNDNNNKKEFILKYIVCENDKACQTDKYCEDDDDEVKCFNIKNNLMSFRCKCPINLNNNDLAMNMDIAIYNCPLHPPSPSDNIIEEIMWKYDLKSCDKCNNNNNNNNSNNNNNNNKWNIDGSDTEFNDENVKNIWSGGEVCLSCLKKNGCRPPAKLREDISQDGDQLLSDLSSLQKTYMEEQMPIEYINDKISGASDISEILIPKRRHSIADRQNNDLNSCWSFASRLEEDCLIQMSTIPTLRSVTL